MTVNVKRKNHKNLSDVDFKIKGVYFPYRSGGIETNGKWVGKTFVYFPSRIPDEVVYSNDERSKLLPGESISSMELRERVWNKEAKRFEFWKNKAKLDRDFFATYKKVFDVHIVIGGDVEVPVWDGTLKKEVPTLFHKGEEMILNEFPASRLKSLLEALDLDASVELVDGKDKSGKPAKVKPFDWEDDLRSELVDKYVRFKVRGEGLDTTFTFKEAKEFEIEEFGSEQNKDDKKQGNDAPVDVDELPF